MFWSMVMISVPLYVVAIILRETLGKEDGAMNSGDGAESFSTLAKAFFNIFRCVVVGDCSDETGRPIFVLVAARYGWAYGVIYGMTVVCMTFGIFNVIIAIYVESTVAAAKHNDMKQKDARMRNHDIFKEKALELALLAYSYKNNLDMSEVMGKATDLEEVYAMEITAEEFEAICEQPSFSDILNELDIAAADHLSLFDTLDVDHGGSVDVDELIAGIKRLRGDARKSDIVAVILAVRHMTEMLDGALKILDGHGKALHALQQPSRH